MSEIINITGNELVVQAAADIGASLMFGYPITPSTEILENWVNLCQTNKDLDYLQTEDEIAAGFGVCGATLAGKIAFTASAGPGNVLLQDSISMAESMRLPFVAIIAQRGGPSTGTVIYSQQETILTVHGGNGEGLRIVYAPGDLQELYEMAQAAFVSAWKYRFPAFVLTDGYLCKTKQNLVLRRNLKKIGVEKIATKNMRNCFSMEEELFEKLQIDLKDFEKLSFMAQAEEDEVKDANLLVIAYGTVAMSVKQALTKLREQGLKIALLRPKTLSPFPAAQLSRVLSKEKKVIFIESSHRQLEMLTRAKIKIAGEISRYNRPAMGITPEEVENFLKKEYRE